MNCHCSVPAVVKPVTNGGANQGKSFVACPLNTCDFFHWVQSSAPPNLAKVVSSSSSSSSSRNVGMSTSVSRLKSNNNDLSSSSSSAVTTRMDCLKITLASFENFPISTQSSSFTSSSLSSSSSSSTEAATMTAWFGVITSCQSTQLNQFFLSFPESARRYKPSFKMWEFSFEIYPEFLSKLKSPPFDTFLKIYDLPSFLVDGVLNFLARLKHSQTRQGIQRSGSGISSSSSSSSNENSDETTIADDNIDNNDATVIDMQGLNLEMDLYEKLYPFQIKGIQFIVNRCQGRGLIADEMGCGKTCQAIGIIQHYRHLWPVLILLPVSLIGQWKRELISFSPNLLTEEDIFVPDAESKAISIKTAAASGIASASTVAKSAKASKKKATSSSASPTPSKSSWSSTTVPSIKIYRVPYTMIEKVASQKRITPEQFGIVIADESHHLKNGDTKKSSAAIPFLKKATVALCLTGTPATNRPVELYAQLHGLLPSVFKDYNGFTQRYCDAKPDKFAPGKIDVKGCSNADELKILLEGIIMIRRLKSDILKDLPQKRREVRYVDVDAIYKNEYNNLEKQQQAKESLLKQTNNCNNDNRNDEALKLRNELKSLRNAQYVVVGNCKLKAVKQELHDLIMEARMHKSEQLKAHEDKHYENQRVLLLLLQQQQQQEKETDEKVVVAVVNKECESHHRDITVKENSQSIVVDENENEGDVEYVVRHSNDNLLAAETQEIKTIFEIDDDDDDDDEEDDDDKAVANDSHDDDLVDSDDDNNGHKSMLLKKRNIKSRKNDNIDIFANSSINAGSNKNKRRRLIRSVV